MRAALAFVVAALLATGCATAPPAPQHIAVPARTAAANALVRAGCFDCLVAALTSYRALAADTGDPAWARRAREVAGLLAIRERALGLVDEQYLERSREGSAPGEELFADIIATLPRRTAGQQFTGDDAQIAMLRTVHDNRERWRAELLERASTSPLAGVTALAFECTHGAGRKGPEIDPILERIGDWADSPLVAFTRATCSGFDPDRLNALLADDERFVEVHFFAGVAATLAGNLDAADQHLAEAYAWHAAWPAVTMSLGNLSMTAEDFDRATAFYDRTLTLVPGNADAQLGRVRALSYGGHYNEALDAANDLLSGGQWYIGDARFWRAWNETQLSQTDDAWSDVHEAAKLVINAEVPKLTGILAVGRGDLARARAEFVVAHARNPDDCETATLLGGVSLELRSWRDATPILLDAESCLDREDERLQAEIEGLRSRPGRERVVAHREQDIAANGRLRAQCWFNLAVAALNEGDAAKAREYAERVSSDERFGERARQLLDRLRPR